MATDLPDEISPMLSPERMRYRAAAFAATQRYPGPVGTLLSREIMAWEEFGYRLGSHRLINELVDHLTPAPTTEAA